MRDLEEMLNKEREARILAEGMMQKMEENSHSKVNGVASPPLLNGHAELENAFEPPADRPATPETGIVAESPEEKSPSQPDKLEVLAADFQERIENMKSEMTGLREQLEAFRQRAEKAEAERDVDRKTLAEMVQQIRQRDEAEKRAAERRPHSPLQALSPPASPVKTLDLGPASLPNSAVPEATQHDGPADEPVEVPSLSRANTIKPSTALLTPAQDPALIQALPYTSMIGVVLFGMGLMAYLNGWQPQPRLDH